MLPMPTNYERAFDDRPDVYAAWCRLLAAVRDRMDPRRYELATFAAAQRLRSSYCSLAHGSILRDRFGEDVRALAGDREGLSEVDLAVMELAEQVAADATAIEESDRQRLRDLGLSDGEIMDVVLTASVRAFWTKTLDGLGVQPDASYAELEPEIREVLVIGRPISTA